MGISEHASAQAGENPIKSLDACLDELADIYYYLLRREDAPSDYRTKIRMDMARTSVRASYDLIADKIHDDQSVGMEVSSGT